MPASSESEDMIAPPDATSLMDKTMYFEDFELGQVFFTPARTITETDIVTYAYLSGDYSAIHTDSEYAKLTSFGQRVAHGPLGMVVAGGLFVRLGIFEKSALAGLEQYWEFKAPLFIGDTIRVRVTISELRPTSDGLRGIVGREMEIINQRGEVVQVGRRKTLVKRRDYDSATRSGDE